MSTDGASQQGADGEEYPSWFSAYLRSLNVKTEEVRAAELDVVLQTCEDVSQVFRSNISAAYRSESKLEAARKAEAEALTQTLLHNPVSYVAPYPEFPWSLISPEQGKICSRLSDDLKPLDFSSKSLKSCSTHFKDLFSKKFVHERVAKISKGFVYTMIDDFVIFVYFNTINSRNPMTESRSGKGKIRHSGSMPEDSGSKYKSPALSQKWGACVI